MVAIKNDKGFTLLEILVAAVLLAGAGFAVIGAMVSVAKLAQPPVKKYTAFNLARLNTENLANSVRQDCLDNPGGTGCPTLSLATTSSQFVGITTTTIDSIPYKQSYSVAKVNPDGDTTDDGYRKVEMKVCWNPDGSAC